jgi:hypothetical protein
MFNSSFMNPQLAHGSAMSWRLGVHLVRNLKLKLPAHYSGVHNFLTPCAYYRNFMSMLLDQDDKAWM